MTSSLTTSTITEAAVFLCVGYFIGAWLSTPSSGTSRLSRTSSSTPTSDYSDEDLKDSDDESDDDGPEIDSTSLNAVPGEVRMALVVRSDLGMQKGKVAAQCAHAAVTCYRLMSEPESQAYNEPMLNRWFQGGQAKIALKCGDKDQMDLLFAKALSLNINAYVIHDAGRTQIPAGSATVLGLGPAPKSVLDKVTGDLRLL